MKLQIKNFKMLEQAELEINGLTVIAGDNDTGKSTIGKLLFTIIQSHHINKLEENASFEDTFKKVLSGVFESHDIPNTEIILSDIDKQLQIYSHNKEQLNIVGNIEQLLMKNVIYIESPMVWMLVELFSKEKVYNIIETSKEFAHMYLLFDLYYKLTVPYESNSEVGIFEELLGKINSLIGGSVSSSKKIFTFHRMDGLKLPLRSVSSGIQNFALLEVLTRNNYIQPNSVLIIDEPEIHLHPQWEYEYAKLISDYVKLGVKVVLTTHSLYMVKALKEFTKDIPDQVNFYLSTKDTENNIKYEDVSLEVYKIFKTFSEPLQSLVWREK